MPILPPTRAAAVMFLIAAGSAACEQPRRQAAAETAATPVTHSEISGTGPKHAVVTLLPADAPPPMPDQPAVLDQYSKQFVPTVLYVRVGQPVEFRNSEDTPHNVGVTRQESGVGIFDVGTEPRQKYVHTFDRVGQYDVRCDIHEGMEATIIATRGSINTIADDNGRFTLPNVPVGSYRLSLTFQGRTVEQALEVKSARTSVSVAQ